MSEAEALADLDAACASIQKENLFVLDLETSGLDPRTDRIVGVALGTKDGAWYVPTVGDSGTSLGAVRTALNPYLIDVGRIMVGHNLKFDLQFLWANKFNVQCRIGDTMVLAHLMDENRAGSGRLALKGKGGLVDELFDVELEEYSTSALAGNLFGKSAKEYAADDARWTLKCWKKMHPLLGRQKLSKFYHEISMPMTRILGEMEMHGMHVDVNYLRVLQKTFEAEALDLEKQVYAAAGRRFNIGSPPQLATVLFDDLNIQPYDGMQKGKKGIYSTAEGVLSRFAHQQPIVQLILDWREKQKLIGTYVIPFIRRALSNSENRIYGNFNQTGTVTLRLSCVADDTVLETSVGSVFIKDLDLTKHPECSIMTHRGRHCRIVDKIYKGRDWMYEVKTASGKSIKCTRQHRFLCRDGWRELRGLRIGDKVITVGSIVSGVPLSRRQYYGDSVREGLCEVVREGSGDCFNNQEDRIESYSVLSSASSVWSKAFPVDKESCQQKLFEGNDGQQARCKRTSLCFVGQRDFTGVARTRCRGLDNRTRDEDERISCASEFAPLRYARGGGGTPETDSNLSKILYQSVGESVPRYLGKGKELSRRPRSFFSCSVRGLHGGSGPSRCYQGVGQCTPSEYPFGESAARSCLLGGQSSRDSSILCIEDEGNSTSKAGNRRKIRGGFCGGEGFGCGSRWGFSCKGHNDEETGPSKGDVSTFRGLQDSPLQDDRGRGECKSLRGFDCKDVGYVDDPIIRITPLGIMDVWDITVEDDASYVAHGFINHNSSDPNLQNLPRAENCMRKAFTAPPGKKLIVADYGQLELRLMAHRSRDAKMIEIYKSGGDIHKNTQDALGLGPTKTDRSIAKNCNFGLLYGLSAQGLKRTLWEKARIDKSLQECFKWRAGFFAAYPGIPQYHARIERYLQEHGYVQSLTGRKRHLKELMKRDYGAALRMAINYTIQSSAADVVMIGMRNFQKRIERGRLRDPRWHEVFMICQVHDEVIAEAPEELAEDVAAGMKEDLESAATLLIPLEATPNIGDNWEEAK